jgi:hypothetical protein
VIAADSVSRVILIDLGVSLLSAIILGILALAAKRALDTWAGAIGTAASKAILASQERGKAIEAVAVDVGHIREQVTPNGGTTNTLGDTMQRLEAKLDEHTKIDAEMFHEVFNRLETE